MSGETTPELSEATKRGLSPLQVLGIVAVAVLVTAVVTVLVLRAVLFPKPFTPVTLSPREEQVLEAKLDRLDPVAARRLEGGRADGRRAGGPPRALQPERYSEEDASREIRFSERELNALLAKNTDLAHSLAIDLSENLISAKLLVPMDPDFPVLGGQTLRVHAGVEMAFVGGRPTVILKGVSIMGVPLPNAWLGGIKNVDLVREFGGDKGFWRSFAAGVEDVRVEDGALRVRLKE
jgi:hypothetical protein